MTLKAIWSSAIVALVAGCGGDTKIQLTPAMKDVPGLAPDVSTLAADGKSGGGENPFGPKRADADKKIAEINANVGLSPELKKQLIDEVERTYKQAQETLKKS